MPFKNEHSARIKNPGQFDRFARQNDKFAPGIDVIFGIKDNNGVGVSSVQAIRFNKKKFTVDQAKAWLKEHDFKFIEFEPAIKSMKEVFRIIEAVLPFQDLPLANRDHKWDAGEARRRIRQWAGGDEVDFDKYSKGFIVVDGPRENLTSYKLPVADIVNGMLMAIPRGIFAVGGVLSGARGGIDLESDDFKRAKNHVARYFSKMKLVAPFERAAKEETHGMPTNNDGSCPVDYPAKRRHPESGAMRCFREAPISENEHELPKNKRGLDTIGTFSAMEELGRKLTKEEVNFLERSPSSDVICGACRFYLRDPESDVGTCQVVDGEIPWFATSDLYIGASAEAKVIFAHEAPDNSEPSRKDEPSEDTPPKGTSSEDTSSEYTDGNDTPDFVEALEKKEFNNFFTIDGGVAVDLGDKIPSDLITTRNHLWALVIEDRKAKTNEATTFQSVDAVGAESRARSTAERTKDPDKVVILAKKVGYIGNKNKDVFKDRNGYRYIQGNLDESIDDLEEGIRPAFGSSGGKRFLAKTIISFIPDHDRYVEAFIGGGAVFFGKKPSPQEVINDKNGDIAHAYRFIKNIHGPESQHISELKKMPTAFSRNTFFKLRDSSPTSAIGRFHRFLYLNAFSFGKSMRSTVKEENGGAFRPLTHRLERLAQVSERLKETKIMNTDFREVIKAHDGANTFFYLDPPYPEQQGHLKTDLTNDDIAAVARRIKGSFIISLPDTKDMRRAFKGFNIKKVAVRRIMEIKSDHMDSEVLISNFPMRQRSEWLG